MWSDILIESIKVLPSLLLAIVALVAVLVFRKPIGDVISRLSGLKIKDVELNFIVNYIDEALEVAEKHEKWRAQIKVTNKDKQNVLKRAKRNLDLVKGVEVLWIDDQPGNNKNEERMLRQLEIEVEYARTTEEAIEKLKSARYDLILSDIARENKSGVPVDSGIDTLNTLVEKNLSLPTIFYIGEFDPAKGSPGYAFGITNRPDELLHLILDILERRKI
ncbi:response regulator [candidate division KSB1 bacterium]|nr:response regulator [candidate division KSB1 bacterium]